MSKSAQVVQQQVTDMRQLTPQPQKTGRQHVAADMGRPATTPDVDTTQPVDDQRPVLEDATEQLLADTLSVTKAVTTTKGKLDMAKKQAAAKKTNGAKKAKSTRQPRQKIVPSGAITGVAAGGTTYLTLTLEDGQITLTPTGSREQNRDIAVKAIKQLLK